MKILSRKTLLVAVSVGGLAVVAAASPWMLSDRAARAAAVALPVLAMGVVFLALSVQLARLRSDVATIKSRTRKEDPSAAAEQVPELVSKQITEVRVEVEQLQARSMEEIVRHLDATRVRLERQLARHDRLDEEEDSRDRLGTDYGDG